VAPSEIEAVLRRLPQVRDCAVVDLPHRFSGSVAAALVVLSPGTPVARAASVIRTAVDDAVPYYQQLHHVELVPVIARSANGKVERRRLRDQLVGLLEQRSQARPATAAIRDSSGEG
jgi:long-chain acyl-CoA synthetase